MKDRLERAYSHPEFLKEFFPNIEPEEVEEKPVNNVVKLPELPQLPPLPLEEAEKPVLTRRDFDKLLRRFITPIRKGKDGRKRVIDMVILIYRSRVIPLEEYKEEGKR